MEDKLIIRGARVHNLKNVNLEIPKNKLVVFSGVSGSGKSSLSFDTIFAEGQRRYIESLSPYARQFLGQMDRPDVDEIIGLSPAIAIDQKALSHNPRSTVGTLTEILDYQRVLFARLGEVFCPNDGTKIEKLSVEEIVDIIQQHKHTRTESALTDTNKHSRGDEPDTSGVENVVTILSPVVRGRKGEYYQLFYDYLNQGYDQVRVDGQLHQLHDKIKLSRYKNHNIDLVIDRVMTNDETRLFEAVESAIHFSKGLVKIIFNKESASVSGDLNQRQSAIKANSDELLLSTLWTCPEDGFSFPEVEPRLFSFNSPYGACPSCHGIGKIELFSDEICPVCNGKRLRPEALSVRIEGKNIYEVNALTIDEAYEFFVNYEAKLSKKDRVIAGNLTKEIIDRLSFLLEVGLDYLALEREAGTLSGGEAQRIRLASQIGSQLSGTLYVLDEPTIGLHERDTDRLIRTLKSLRDQKNTVIIVEHDERTIKDSDYLVDLGPMAGKLGGEVVAQGAVNELIQNHKKHERSLTLQYLSNERKMYRPTNRREKTTEKIKIVGAKANNLKNVTVEIPLRKFVCLTGVSGSGKSSLMYDVLYENMIKMKNRSQDPMTSVENIYGTVYLDRVTIMDQSPIGRSPRSNPATYTG
ncbi:hypothetical protein A3F08_03030, partial [Candidatus Berkelbacteria bacterium RIFCSPHIGHO2_12_FULL_36_9]